MRYYHKTGLDILVFKAILAFMNKALKTAIVNREPFLAQWQIARRIGVDDSRMSGFIHGRFEPTPKQKGAMARILKTPVDQLFPSTSDAVSA